MLKNTNRFLIIEQSFVRKRRGGKLFELQKVAIEDDGSTSVRYRMGSAKGRTDKTKRQWTYFASIEPKGLVTVYTKEK